MDMQKLNQNLNKLNKFLFIILGIAVAIWIGVEVFIGSKVEYIKEQMEENLCEASNVKEMLARLNLGLPSKLDEINTLEKIVCENRRFVYHYALGKGLEMDESALNDKDIAELKEEQTKELKKEFCEDTRLKAVREIAEGVDFVYFLGAKELIRVKLESKDCE
ncbi:hypothetical protein [uncultured Campylobacter sp.]|uniref:hypothetical protein n=1 Tax=uncultured Campylobacter sp. TaxID=218934 RepID=UPI0028ED4F7B|nr:hypothetical protein [uncultured Campylobacter sp.]